MAQIATKLTQANETGVLHRKEIPDDEPLVMVKVKNSTAEPDGIFKNYYLRVPPRMTRAKEAVAWTFGERKNKYRSMVETWQYDGNQTGSLRAPVLFLIK